MHVESVPRQPSLGVAPSEGPGVDGCYLAELAQRVACFFNAKRRGKLVNTTLLALLLCAVRCHS